MPALHTEVDLGAALPPLPADAAMEKFETQCATLEQSIAAAEQSLRNVDALLSSGAPPSRITPSLDMLETGVSSIRTQLSALAEANKRAARGGGLGSASTRIRVTRFQKLAADFTAFLGRFERIKDRYRASLNEGIRGDVEGLGLGVTVGQVDAAVGEEVQMEAVLRRASPEMRMQVENVRERNRALGKLNKDVAQLHEMFVELSYLTETQQSLINEIEHNVEGAKEDVVHADEEIVKARGYQRSARKKKMLIAVVLFLLLLGVIIFLVVQVST